MFHQRQQSKEEGIPLWPSLSAVLCQEFEFQDATEASNGGGACPFKTELLI